MAARSLLVAAVFMLCNSSSNAVKVLFIGASNNETGGDIAGKILNLDKSIQAKIMVRGSSMDKAKTLYDSFGCSDVDIVKGDMYSADDIGQAAKGVSAIWFVTALPTNSNHSSELEIAEAVVAGAKSAGVDRIVFGVSSAPEQFPKTTWMSAKTKVEKCLAASGLSWASIWCGWNADSTVPKGFPAVQAVGIHPFVYQSNMRIYFTFHIDIARASVKLLNDKSLKGTFSVYDPQPHTMQSFADTMTKVVGHKVSPLPFHFLGYLFKYVLTPLAPYMDEKLVSVCQLIPTLWDMDYGAPDGLSADADSNKRGLALLDNKATSLEEWLRSAGLPLPQKAEL